MSDSFDVSARVWPVIVGGAELCRVVAHDGIMMIYYGPRQSAVLSGKLELIEFVRLCSDAQPESDAYESMNNALTSAALFAFGNSGDTRLGLKSRPKDEMRDWIESMLGRRHGSIVKTKDLRKAWNEHLCNSHNSTTLWTAHRFHERLKEYDYKVERLCGPDGTNNFIVGVFMRDGRAPTVRPAKRKVGKPKYSPPPELQ